MVHIVEFKKGKQKFISINSTGMGFFTSNGDRVNRLYKEMWGARRSKQESQVQTDLRQEFCNQKEKHPERGIRDLIDGYRTEQDRAWGSTRFPPSIVLEVPALTPRNPCLSCCGTMNFRFGGAGEEPTSLETVLEDSRVGTRFPTEARINCAEGMSTTVQARLEKEQGRWIHARIGTFADGLSQGDSKSA